MEYQKIRPYISLSEWRDADTETILKDLVLCKEKNLSALSVEESAYSLTKSLATGSKIKIYALTNNPNIAPPEVTQLFINNKTDLPISSFIITFTLNRTEHLDIKEILFESKNTECTGFLLIDEKSKYLHRFYDFLNSLDSKFDGEIHYCAGTNDIRKIYDAYNLVKKIKPKLLSRLKLFVTNQFDFSAVSI